MLRCCLLVLASMAVTYAKLNLNTNTCSRDTSSCLDNNVARLPALNHAENEHYYIGGLFPVHEKSDSIQDCSQNPISSKGLINLEAFLWAVSKYKHDHEQVGIGAVAFDSCSRGEQTVENILSFEECKVLIENVEPRNLLAYVGPMSNKETMESWAVLKDLKKTIVSPAANSASFKNNDKYPFLLRSVGTDEHDATMMAAVLNTINVKHVVVAYQDDDYGRDGSDKLIELMKANGGCAVYKQAFPVNADVLTAGKIFQNFVDQADGETQMMVIYADADNTRRFLLGGNSINKLYDFTSYLGTSGWCRKESVIENMSIRSAFTLSKATPTDFKSTVDDFKKHFESLKPSNNKNNPWFKSYWEQTFGCSLISDDKCADNNITLNDMDSTVPYTIMAVKSIVHGVKKTVLDHCDANNTMHICNTLLNDRAKGHYILERISANEIYSNGELANKYKKYNINRWSAGSFDDRSDNNAYDWNEDDNKLKMETAGITIRSNCPDSPCIQCGELPPPSTTPTTTAGPDGTTTKGNQLSKDNVPIMVKRGQEMTGAFVLLMSGEDRAFQTRFDIGHNWIIALGVLSGLGILCVIVFEIYIIYKLIGTKNTHWRTMWLGQVLLCGIFLSYLTLFAYIPVPTKATCGITRFGVGFCYSVLFSVLLVKLMVILTSKSSDALIPGDIESPNYLKGIYQFLMFVFAVGVQLVIDIQWLITVPPEAVQVTTNNGETAWVCNHYTWEATGDMGDSINMLKFVRNEFENHLITLVYVMFLILITTIVALRSHGIITNHRESVFIGICAGFSIPIFLAWGLVGGLNREHLFAQEFGDAAIAFGLFLTATLIMFGMFLPKVRQLVNIGMEGIYLEDDRETYYAGSVIMAPPSYKSKPASIVYAQNGGLYSDPVVLTDPNALHLKASSVYSAPPTYIKKGDASISAGSKVLKVTGDLTGKTHPIDKRRPISEINYGRPRPRSERGTLTRSRSHQELGSL